MYWYGCISLVILLSCEDTQKEWRLVWEENFDQTDGFDPAVWSKIPRGISDWNNYMSDYDPLYDVEDGNLILRGMVNPGLSNDSVPFITGGIYTKDKKTFTYGRLEICARLFGARGAWPAIWMLPQVGGWPDGGEIDIMERLNDESIAYQTVHSRYTQDGHKDHPKQGGTGPIDKDDYNVYAVEIYPDSLSFYINDTHTFTYPRIAEAGEEQFPFGKPFYLLIDMQLGGSWVGEVYAEDLPLEMWVDWVRYYQK